MTNVKQLKPKLTYDYIKGLVEGEGNFTFSTIKKRKRRVPAFQLKMHVRDAGLITAVRDTMGLTNKIYIYDHPGHDGAKRQPYVLLIVREIGNLKNIVVPFFYNRLVGSKGSQFDNWLDTIGHDPWIPESYKVIYRLHKNGYYRKNPKFGSECQA